MTDSGLFAWWHFCLSLIMPPATDTAYPARGAGASRLINSSTALSVTHVRLSNTKVSHIRVSHTRVSHTRVSHIRVSHIRVSHIRLSHITVSHIRVSHIIVSYIRVWHIRVSHIKVSHIRVSHIKVLNIRVSHIRHNFGDQMVALDACTAVWLNIHIFLHIHTIKNTKPAEATVVNVGAAILLSQEQSCSTVQLNVESLFLRSAWKKFCT
jgi:hypothetical protein